MRFAVTALLWLATTVALGVAVPAAWAQVHVVDERGFAALAHKAAADPRLQSAMADELATRTIALIAARGGGRYRVDGPRVHAAAAAFTAGPAFPPLFAQANRAAHAWAFTDPRFGRAGTAWAVDVSPMLRDGALAQLLADYRVTVPADLTVALTQAGPPLRQGQLSRLSTWGPWLSIGAAALAVVCALLTLAAARRRGKALTSLGVSALLVGAAGWAGTEVAGRRVDGALRRGGGDIRRVAEAMVAYAEAGVRLWLDVTLLAGVALVVLGVLVAMAGSLVRKGG
ncbi:hypothetical protein [Mycobacterium servetii]|uniref:Uncharacterized protein n=1 Tax=Mycobacterium servetii TaxID=3237418 RepID=A0ABV4CAB7_9MYCO